VSYQLSATIVGERELRAAFAKAPALAEQELRKVIGGTAHDLNNRIKSNAPVDKGALRASFHVDKGALRASFHVEGPTGSGLGIEARVGTNLTIPPYPYFQEVGTGIYGPNHAPITPKSKPFLIFKTKDGRWVRTKAVMGTPAKYYVKRAYDETLPKWANDLRSMLQRITAALAQ